jgi:uncharacterized membrane protein
MNCKLFLATSTKALVILAAITAAQAQEHQTPRYSLTDLGPSGNPFSQATGVTDNGLVVGFDTASNGASHSVLWYKGHPKDINASLGGPNSAAGGVNLRDQVLG